MLLLQSQDPVLSEKLRQLGEPIRTTGSLPKVALIMAGLIAVLIVAYYLGKLQEILRRPIVVQDAPFDLFVDLLRRLRLSGAQRRLMRRLARDLGLKNPSAILISEALFDQRLAEWHKAQSRVDRHTGAAAAEEVWQGIRQRLFP